MHDWLILDRLREFHKLGVERQLLADLLLRARLHVGDRVVPGPRHAPGFLDEAERPSRPVLLSMKYCVGNSSPTTCTPTARMLASRDCERPCMDDLPDGSNLTGIEQQDFLAVETRVKLRLRFALHFAREELAAFVERWRRGNRAVCVARQLVLEPGTSGAFLSSQASAASCCARVHLMTSSFLLSSSQRYGSVRLHRIDDETRWRCRLRRASVQRVRLE